MIANNLADDLDLTPFLNSLSIPKMIDNAGALLEGARAASTRRPCRSARRARCRSPSAPSSAAGEDVYRYDRLAEDVYVGSIFV